ncbi:MAG: hypothetical protein WC981_02905, partial [Candidatus Dojkabacteria bacterium]
KVMEFFGDQYYIDDDGVFHYINLGILAGEINSNLFKNNKFTGNTGTDFIKVHEFIEGKRDLSGEEDLVVKERSWEKEIRGILNYVEETGPAFNQSIVIGLTSLYDPQTGDLRKEHTSISSKWPFYIKGVLNSIEQTSDVDKENQAYFPYRKIYFTNNPHMNTEKTINRVAANNYLRNVLPKVTASWSAWGQPGIKLFDLAHVNISAPVTIRRHPQKQVVNNKFTDDYVFTNSEDLYMITSIEHSMDGKSKDYTIKISGERWFLDDMFYPRMEMFGYTNYT